MKNLVIQFHNYVLDKDSSSKPRFVFYYEGKYLDEVAGADIPALVERIYKYLPMVY